MTTARTPAIESVGIIKGHYECRHLTETLPVLTHLLAMEVIAQRAGEATLKHPNTDWLLVVHESGPEVPDKPQRNHYGVRVTNNQEVDRAYDYLVANKEPLGLRRVVRRREREGSYSLFFMEPGGNYWEIESYENRHAAGLPYEVSYPWTKPLTEEQFSGRGYIPQALTHGTIECNDWASSVKFYKEGLGMDVITHVVTPKPHNIKHPSKPWYVVSLEVPLKNRRYLGPLQRFTIAVASPEKLRNAHTSLRARREELAIVDIGEICENSASESFLLCDLNRNWWEVEYARN